MKNFTSITKKPFFSTLFVLFITISAFAQTRAIYFTTYNTATATFPYAAAGYTATAVSSGSLNYSGLVAVNDGRTVWQNNNASTTLDISTAPYLSYTVNMNGTKKFLFDRFVLCGVAVLNSSIKMQLRWSVDSYASSLGEFTTTSSSYRLTSVDLSSQGNITASSITFRIYCYNAAGRIYNSDTGPYTSPDGTPSTYGAYGQNVALWYTSLITLPLTWGDVTASLQNNNSVEIKWNTFNEMNVKNFDVQYSPDGNTYQTIRTIPAANQSENNYTIIHNPTENGKLFYRIRQTDIDGKFTYSPVRVVTIVDKAEINMFPNPVINELTINVRNSGNDKTNITISNTDGQQIYRSKNVLSGSTLHIPTNTWKPGMYVIKMSNEEGQIIYREKIIKK